MHPEFRGTVVAKLANSELDRPNSLKFSPLIFVLGWNGPNKLS